MALVRTLAVWVPDWPILALLREASTAVRTEPVVAIVEKNVVVACSAAARADGVRRGQRRRDAQARSPRLRIVPSDAERDVRAFGPVVAAVESVASGAQILRPGLCVLRARGIARYYDGEDAAAAVLRGALAEAGLTDVRIGVADGPFTAEQAARTTRHDAPVRIVPERAAAAFLAPLPVLALGDEELAVLLARLGVNTLGEFAALPAERVAERLGTAGVRLHALAGGGDSRAVQPRTPPPELQREVAFEPPLELADQVAFGMRRAAEEFVSALGERALVCTEVRVLLCGERGERSERVWLHPRSFDAAAVVDRVRWQLAESSSDGGGFASGVALVRLVPEAVDEASHHAAALFGGGPDERVHHALSRVQAILGHRGVLTPVVGGGRWLAERQVLVPWGDRAVLRRDRAQPWPGSMRMTVPASVFPEPQPADLRDARGLPVAVDERGGLSAAPDVVVIEGAPRRVLSWAGPWQIAEREWDALRARVAQRFQVVDDRQDAWLLLVEDGQWRIEARYD